MKFIHEIFLTKKFVAKEEWSEFIHTVSNYNGLLRRWKIILINSNNQIRYFVKTRCSLPTTINHLDSFLLKRVKEIKIPKSNRTFLSFPKLGSSIVDIMNYSEIKSKGTLVYLEMSFQKLYNQQITSSVCYCLNKHGTFNKYRCFFALPTSLLSVDFEGNKRYFYKSPPKYLDINKILHLLNTDSNHALLSVDTFPYLQGNFYLNQNHFSFDKHSIIMGSSGCGKSKLISLFIHNIYQNESLRSKYKVVVIDPHASLEQEIGGFGKVIDFQSQQDSIDLFMNHREDIISSTELLLDLLKSLIADQYNAKIERVLRHSIHLLLTNESFNFTNLRRLLLDIEYRNHIIKELKLRLPISVIDFFLSDFNELKTKYYGEAISPIISFIDEMEMIPVFNKEQTSQNLTHTIHNQFLTIFSLDRNKLGNKVTKTISGLIMQQLFTIIQNKEFDEHILFIIDEVSVVENPILAKYLSEARKYHLSIILAGQYFNQISEELKSAIFANVSNYFIFRMSKIDASALVDNFPMKIPLDDSKEQKIKLLTELNHRECVVRIDHNGILFPAFKGTTLDYTSIPRVKQKESPSFSHHSIDVKANTHFQISGNTRLKDILISTSTSRKGV